MFLFPLLLAVAPTVPNVVDELEKPKLVLSVERTEIYVGDPMAIKIQLTNTTKAGVPIDQSFEFCTGQVGVEACLPGSGGEYQQVFHGGLAQALRPAGREWKLKPGASLVAYEYLYAIRPDPRQPPGPWFSKPGRWRLRARTGFKGKLLVSEPVTVEVRERDREGMDALHQCFGTLWGATVDHGKISASSLELLTKSLPSLGKSNAAALVVRTQKLAELYSANLKTRQQVWESLQKHRAGLPELSRELLDLQTCDILLVRGELNETETLLKQITLDSSRRYELMAKLEDQKRP